MAAPPVAGRLPAGAGHRATVVVVDDCRINASADSVLYVLVHQVRECLTIRGIGISAIGVILLYGGKVYCSYSAIWDFETIFNSRLTAKFSVLPARRSVRALRCPQSLRAGPFVQCEGTKAVSCGRFVGIKAAKTTLLGYISSSMSAEPPPKSRDKWNKVCSQQPGKPVSSLHPFIPQPQGDERPGTYLRRTVRAVRRTLDIIYRDCVTGCRGPNPSTSFRYRTQSRLC